MGVQAHEIRQASVDDAPELARLLTLLGHPASASDLVARWSPWSAAGNSALVAPRGDGTLAGLAVLHSMWVLHRAQPLGRITALVVDQEQRGRGLGRRLVEAAEAHFTGAGCGMLEITSNFALVEAHAFYERIGYQRTSVRLAKVLASPLPSYAPP
ncbi:MAG: GNAT family N-acetyltransferase [Pseudomonadota bacterium]